MSGVLTNLIKLPPLQLLLLQGLLLLLLSHTWRVPGTHQLSNPTQMLHQTKLPLLQLLLLQGLLLLLLSHTWRVPGLQATTPASTATAAAVAQPHEWRAYQPNKAATAAAATAAAATAVAAAATGTTVGITQPQPQPPQ